MVKDFVYRVGIKQGLSEQQAKSAGGKIFTFGSYKLGVHNTGIYHSHYRRARSCS